MDNGHIWNCTRLPSGRALRTSNHSGKGEHRTGVDVDIYGDLIIGNVHLLLPA